MKWIYVLLCAASTLRGQTGTASIAGTVVEMQKEQPIPSAIVTAMRDGLPPFSARTRAGADGAFLLRGLPAGNFSLCVQVQGGFYVDPCRWKGKPTTVNLAAGQAETKVKLKLTAASVVNISVQDDQNFLSQKTKDGRMPELTLGVWGPDGLFASAVAPTGPFAGLRTYQVAVPKDTALTLHISSRDLKLGNSAGVTLPANANQQAFQHATGDPNPKSFAFRVLGVLP